MLKTYKFSQSLCAVWGDTLQELKGVVGKAINDVYANGWVHVMLEEMNCQ